MSFTFSLSSDPARMDLEPTKPLILSAGTWAISLIDNIDETLIAFNGWSGQVVCDDDGKVTKGFVCEYLFYLLPIKIGHLIQHGTFPIDLKDVRASSRHKSARKAFQARPDPVEIILSEDQILVIYVGDTSIDDQGGLTFKIEKIS